MTKILVIEDEELIRELIEDLLIVEEFEVITSENGEQGVELAKQYLPDLIICDVMMPKMDGYAVLTTLKDNPETNTIPFIFLTAKSTKTDQRQGMELGADDYLTKPFTRAELMGAIAIRLEKKKAIERYSQEKIEQLTTNLTSSLPHELLTPLNGIMGFADLLSGTMGPIDEDEVKEMAQEIKFSAQRLHQLIQNYLLYAQLEIAKTNPGRLKNLLTGVTYSTEEAIAEAAEIKAMSYNRQSDLQLKLQDTKLLIQTKWLTKIVSELVDNAFKFSSKGTPVVVKTMIEKGSFIIWISDRGRGMTPEQIKQVGAYMQFERKVYEQQGSGLGLVIAQQLTELFGGNLTINSIRDQQTTICVTLPLTNSYNDT